MAVQNAIAATNADPAVNSSVKAEMRAVEQAFLKLRDEVRRYPLALQFIRDKRDT